MPTERELLALCLRWIEDSPEDAFDRAMLIDAVKAKLSPNPWVGLTEEDFSAINQSCLTKMQAAASAESILKEKNA